MSDYVNLNYADNGFYVSWTEKVEKDGKKVFNRRKVIFTSQADMAEWVKNFKFTEDTDTYGD